jgi:hypothetical protein
MNTREAARQRSRPVPAALLGLSLIPVAAGTMRLVQLAGSPELIPADHRFAQFRRAWRRGGNAQPAGANP